MISLPQFSEFRPLRLQDRDRILEKLDTYQPETPELTFNNGSNYPTNRKHKDAIFTHRSIKSEGDKLTII